MSILQINSAEPGAVALLSLGATRVLARAEAMGLLPSKEPPRHFDWQLVRSILRSLAETGIGRDILQELSLRSDEQLARMPCEAWERIWTRLYEALGACPRPEAEWPALLETFRAEDLADLVGVSTASLHRYAGQTRPTPDEVADRVHFIALLTEQLAGAYNPIGIRRWFVRPRSALGGHTPRETLVNGWNPNDHGPQQIQDLAGSLQASPAT